MIYRPSTIIQISIVMLERLTFVCLSLFLSGSEGVLKTRFSALLSKTDCFTLFEVESEATRRVDPTCLLSLLSFPSLDLFDIEELSPSLSCVSPTLRSRSTTSLIASSRSIAYFHKAESNISLGIVLETQSKTVANPMVWAYLAPLRQFQQIKPSAIAPLSY